MLAGERSLLLVVRAYVYVEGFITLAMQKEEREEGEPSEFFLVVNTPSSLY